MRDLFVVLDPLVVSLAKSELIDWCVHYELFKSA